MMVGHGSTRERWRKPLEALRDDLAERLDTHHICLAYLELCAPSVEQVLETVVQDGYGMVTILPMFMSSGGHVARDLKPMLDRLASRHPDLDLKLVPAFGELSVVRTALAEFLAQKV